jgi:peroxiredoxin
MRKLSFSLILCISICLGGCTGSQKKDDKPVGGPKKVVGDFSLSDLKGNKVRLSDFKDKVIFISFWASWCEPCRTELPQLEKIWKRHKDKGFELISIAIDPPDLEGTVRQMARRYRYKFPVLLDPETEVSSRFNPAMELPFGLLIDRDGKIVTTHQGYRIGDEETIEKEITDLLAD